MHFFSLANVITCLAACTVRSTALPHAASLSKDLSVVNADTTLEARDIGPYIEVIGIAAVKGVAIITKIAIEIGSDTVKDLGEWDKARAAFTHKTTNEMWARNQDKAKYPAAICYNLAYHLKNPAGIDGKVSAKVELNLLHTNYDCMYMTGNNQFYTDADGGDANLSYTYDTNRCSFDKATGDLTCR